MGRSASLPVTLFVTNPVLTSVTPTGGVGTSYTYKLVAIAPDGTHTAASAGVTDAAGPTALDGTHFETLVWTDPVSAPAFVDVYRTVGGATQGKIARVAAGVGTLVDNGLVGDGTTPPTVNGTGVGAAVPVSDLRNMTVQLGGTFVGSIKLQGRIDPISTFNDLQSVEDFSVAVVMTTPGIITTNSGVLSMLRAVMTAYTSGAPVMAVAG